MINKADKIKQLCKEEFGLIDFHNKFIKEIELELMAFRALQTSLKDENNNDYNVDISNAITKRMKKIRFHKNTIYEYELDIEKVEKIVGL